MRRFSYPILAVALIVCATAGGQAEPPAPPVPAVPATPDRAPVPPGTAGAPGAPGMPAPPMSAGVPGTPFAPGMPGVPVTPPVSRAPGMPPGSPTSLESVIQGAVSASPEVQVAEAQLREAEARLQQARIEAVQKAIEAYQGRMKAEETSQAMRQALGNTPKPGTETPEDLYAMKRLAEAEAEVAKYDARLRGLVGSAPVRGEGRPPLMKPRVAAPGPRVQAGRPYLESVGGEIVKQLASPVSIEFEAKPLTTITDYLAEYFGVNMIVDASLGPDYVIPYIRLDDVPLKYVLLAIADQSGDLCFLVRSYGIFATTRENAETLDGPSIPDTVPYYIPVKGGAAPGDLSSVGSDIADAVTSAVTGAMEGVQSALSEVAKQPEPEAGKDTEEAPAAPQKPDAAPPQQR